MTTAETTLPVKKFGTFKGVFLPSALTIFGVIMYLRVGWVTGNVGLFQTLVIITMSSAITFVTALSISATATNMQVSGGGAYFMISRSLGLEAGSAVGIPLYLAQALGVSFYLAGFGESLQSLFPNINIPYVAIGALLVLSLVAYKSADIALKSQVFLFVLIIVSLFSFYFGETPNVETMENLKVVERDVTFWVAFAVFFPAVTGILAGVSMSGDLENPARSLPLGTIAAVICGYLVYMTIPFVLVNFVEDPAVLKNSAVMQKIAKFEYAILAGIWGATLSSALGSLLGAPRTLQALAKDGVLSRHFRFLGRTDGPSDEPRVATVFTMIVALAGILMGDLNVLAPILSMFFLTAYGVLNFSAGIEGMIANPAWRPKFRVPWWISLIGSFLCFSTMFMINPGATIIALVISAGVYYLMQRKNLRTNFGDMRRGILMFLARYSIFKLAELQENAKSWRPNVLVFSGSPTARWYLVELANAITHGKGFLTVATIVPRGSHAEDRMGSVKKTISDYLRKRNVPALVNVSVSDDVMSGVTALVRTYGMGSLIPNTIMIGETEVEDNFLEFMEMMVRIYQAKRNLVIVRKSQLDRGVRRFDRRIDVWWGRERENAGLSLALGYMLQNSNDWAGTTLALKSIITVEKDVEPAGELLRSFLTEGRVEAESRVYLAEPSKEGVFAEIKRQSADADLVFMGMEPPNLEKFIEDREPYLEQYASYYKELLERTRGFPQVAFVLTAEDVKFTKIFS